MAVHAGLGFVSENCEANLGNFKLNLKHHALFMKHYIKGSLLRLFLKFNTNSAVFERLLF